MKVLVSDPVAPQAIALMKEAGLDVMEHKYPPEELEKEIANFDAILVRSATKVTRKVIEGGAKLRFIGRGGVGLDNIDLVAAKEKGITVANTPGASARSVAELAIAHIFAQARFISRATAGLRDAKWEKKQLKGSEVLDKTLGILGIGSIGVHVARMGAALGMNVIAHDPFVKALDDAEVDLVSFDELLERSDFLSLHLPKTEETTGLIGEDAFKKMKKGAILINCARGGIVDEPALAAALKEGHLAGAGIDVFAKEPVEDNELLHLPSVTMTPHIGASTKEGQFRVGMEIAQKVVDFFKN